MRLATTLALLAAMSAPALAHPGSHSDVTGLSAAVQHFLSSPFHIGIVAFLILALCALVGELGMRKIRQDRNNK
ncbi:MAG: hypothetical protein JJ866_12390 [Roseibium sp.]|uniref:hypothetical protein n=1 Tax=Roseibium sp. TaxID=1936156 RepID=UPI001B10ED8A|nr:hypothetical protein [Roseibium sp.]MBO6892732.1 hypothetical protein [Roseibium sp.]MBO6931707.1 hypothetical protein [Roseibium sp.]